MLRRISRVLVAVPDLDAGSAAVRQTFGLTAGRRYDVPDVGAASEELSLGDGIVQLLQPVADGPVARFLQEHGGGVYGIGVQATSLADSRLRVEQSGRQAHPLRLDGAELMCLKREQLPGLTVWFAEGDSAAARSATALAIREVTCLVEDRDAASETYTRVFGPPLLSERFRNDAYGYLATTIYYGERQAPGRVEIAQPTNPATAIGRFWARHGVSAYMVTLEVEDFAGTLAGFEARSVRFSREPQQPDSIAYIHPSALAGCFAAVVAAPGMQAR
jgi:catechol 2,3-dioxygenase-like lactoylglutathione lyase family enzyme